MFDAFDIVPFNMINIISWHDLKLFLLLWTPLRCADGGYTTGGSCRLLLPHENTMNSEEGSALDLGVV